MKQSVKLVVYGRVQGVYFRKFTQHKAKRLGVCGSVMNLPDGGVEIMAQAETAVLQVFINWCYKGPITARVDRVDIVELTDNDAWEDFVIN